MTDVTPPTDAPATHPVARYARPGGRRASRSRRGPLVASLVLHGLVLALGTLAARHAPRAGPPDAVGLVAMDVPPADDARPDDAPEPLDDVEVLPPEPPTLPPVVEPDAPAPDAPTPPDDEPAPPPDEDVVSPPPPTSVPAPADPTRRTRRPVATVPPPTAPPVAPSTPVVVAAAPARGARPPLVAVASPTPPLVPGGAPGTTLVVVLEYTIGPDGVVTDAVVRGGSGSEALDASTRAFVLAHWRYAPPGEPRRVARRFVFTYGG